jgi:hypothetical protein
MSNKALVKSIKRNTDGSIDEMATYLAYSEKLEASHAKSLERATKKLNEERDETLAAFETDLKTYAETRGAWDAMSAEYVNACFDRFNGTVKGGCITKPVIISMVSGRMVDDGKIKINQMKMAGEMISAYLDDCSAPVDEATDDTLFTIHKGEGGGFRRVKKSASVPA